MKKNIHENQKAPVENIPTYVHSENNSAADENISTMIPPSHKCLIFLCIVHLNEAKLQENAPFLLLAAERCQ